MPKILNDELISDYFAEIELVDKLELSQRNKYLQLKRILERSCKEITSNESLQFPSLFSRLVFIAQKYSLPKSLEWQLQKLRLKSNFLLRSDDNAISAKEYKSAKSTIDKFMTFLSGQQVDDEIEVTEKENTNVSSHLDKLRVQVIDIDEKNEILICKADALDNVDLHVRYNVISVNDYFNATINRIWIGAQMNLLDIKVDETGCYIPRLFVLEPDYLIDASAMAECFPNYGSSHLHYFMRKFEQPSNRNYILLGNLANFFLDELIYSKDAADLKFEDVFMKSFRQMPFEYSSCIDISSNNDFREFMTKAQQHFENIKRVVSHDMPANGFEIIDCVLEPSFFCEKYGFQGRLDLLQPFDADNDIARIVELKSGKPPYPPEDATRIATNHQTQTVIYRLMIQSVFDKDARQIYAIILYSAVNNHSENMRLSAPYKQLEKEIINVRNQVVATEHDLYIGDSHTVECIFKQLFDLDNYGRVPQFFVDKLDELEKILVRASDIEKRYFFRYINFISREIYLQKMGDEGYDSAMSTSALWNTTFQERKEALDLISDLEIENIDESGRDMKILFRRNESADFVNFREGEICILYPHQSDEDSVLNNQILKGTVVEISSHHVLLRFRYKQRNLRFFARYKYWAIEHDKLDHSYNAMFRSLFKFLSVSQEKKELLLGMRQPESNIKLEDANNLSKDEKKKSIIDKALGAKDYFLIVGPPGTGKTSIFARQLIEQLHNDPDTNILVMAYTNRAVDELCAAICSVFENEGDKCDKYIRVGSELSCGDAYRSQLLQNIAYTATNRKELADKIKDTRIFVGTLASINGKPELFGLKKFDVAIIDEASQILEPQIIGLLPQFDKFIMIGDHKQLSTITLQDEQKSKVEDELLNHIGLYDCRESLFERLYSICQSQGWSQAYDTLTYHGRMHHEIASFVNTYFYDDLLQVATDRQLVPLDYVKLDKDNRFHSLIASTRFAFIPVRDVDNSNLSDKVNEAEAEQVVALTKALLELYAINNKSFDPHKTLGIITPYRNQIALIKHKLEMSEIPALREIMVDTVERYQGSQRDVIMFSCCFNKVYQLRYFSNLNREGTVDRKLNVALTRAREQLFLIGNDYILQQNPIYRNLLNYIKVQHI